MLSLKTLVDPIMCLPSTPVKSIPDISRMLGAKIRGSHDKASPNGARAAVAGGSDSDAYVYPPCWRKTAKAWLKFRRTLRSWVSGYNWSVFYDSMSIVA